MMHSRVAASLSIRGAVAFRHVSSAGGRALRAEEMKRRPLKKSDELDRNLTLEARDFIRSAVEERVEALDSVSRRVPYRNSASEFLGQTARKEYEITQKRPVGPDVSEIEDARPIAAASEQAIRLEQRIAAVIESAETSTPVERGDRLVAHVGEAREQGLPLRSTTCEAIMGTWMSTIDPTTRATPETAALDDARGTSTIATFRYFEHMLQLHFYMRSQFIAPTPVTIEHLVTAVNAETALRGPTERLLGIATGLMSDHFRYMALPTRTTYTNFFEICAANRVMDMAVVQFAEAQEKLFIQPDSNMCRAIVEGLVKSGQPDDAVAFLAKLKDVPTDQSFLNAAMKAFIATNDPMAAFAAYRALCCVEEAPSRGVEPNTETFYTLLLACQKTDTWVHARFILSEMQRYGVRGDEKTLNALLKALLMDDLVEYARLLAAAMRRKRVAVWPSLEEAMAAVGHAKVREGQQSVQRSEGIVEPSRYERNERRDLENMLMQRSKEGALLAVPPTILAQFLDEKGLRRDESSASQQSQRSSSAAHARLARSVHRYFYGVKPPSLGRSNTIRRTGRRTNDR